MRPKHLELDRIWIYFTLYSVIGWLYEVFLEVVVYHWGFSNRGVLWGPWLPIYGIGAMLFLLAVYPLIQEKVGRQRLKWIPAVFLLCMLIATTTELIASYILEWRTGAWPWQTYADYGINFQARIALNPAVRFGLGGVLFLYVLQPLFEKLTDWMGERRCRQIAILLAILFVADILYTKLLR